MNFEPSKGADRIRVRGTLPGETSDDQENRCEGSRAKQVLFGVCASGRVLAGCFGSLIGGGYLNCPSFCF